MRRQQQYEFGEEQGGVWCQRHGGHDQPPVCNNNTLYMLIFMSTISHHGMITYLQYLIREIIFNEYTVYHYIIQVY